MSLQKAEKVQSYVRQARELATLHERYHKVRSKPDCDKYNLAFGGDDRFSVFSCKVFLDCHTGWYGNSSCSTFGNIDNALAQTALNKVLNRHLPKILAEMSDEIMKEARLMHAAAMAEIETLQASLALAVAEPSAQEVEPENAAV